MNIFPSFLYSDRSLANALRRESLQLDRTLRSMVLQYQRELSGVCGAQLELRKTLDKLGGPQRAQVHLGKSTTGHTSTPSPGTLQPRGSGMAHTKPCCPNHIVCSTCNLRLRLADTVTRQFTPSLWTMYCRPVSKHGPGEACMVYRMPSFVEHRHLSVSDNSIRYLPFI